MIANLFPSMLTVQQSPVEKVSIIIDLRSLVHWGGDTNKAIGGRTKFFIAQIFPLSDPQNL